MSEYIYRMAAQACDPAAYSKVKSEVSVQITSRTKARRAEAHEEFNESEVLQSGDKPDVCQSHFFTHLKVLKSASCYQALPGEIFHFFLLHRTKKKLQLKHSYNSMITCRSQDIHVSLLEI